MAETQVASTGWNGEVWISTDATAANLDELVEVRSFTPGATTASRVETTTLKTPGRRQTFTPGLIENGEASIVINARRGSDTYLLIKSARDAGDERYIRFNYPELGVLAWTDDVLGVVLGFDEGEIGPDSNMEITVTIAINDEVASGAYVAPGP